MGYRSTEEQAAYRQRAREIIQGKKDVPCVDCGLRYGYWVMDFDHRDDEKKLYNVNKMPGRHGIPRILTEISKCDVVCANCHRNRTWTRRQVRVAQLAEAQH